MARAQKIFPAHAAEVAHKLLGALKNERLAGRFVDSYVAEFNRRGLKADALQYHELVGTLGREMLLVMLTRLYEKVPRLLAPRKSPGRQRRSSGRRRTAAVAEVLSADAFLREFWASLVAAVGWKPAEAEEFRRDLDLYLRLSAGKMDPKTQRRAAGAQEGPFVDRAALLLDPSMMEKARRAAGKLRIEIDRVTDKVLASVLRARR